MDFNSKTLACELRLAFLLFPQKYLLGDVYFFPAAFLAGVAFFATLAAGFAAAPLPAFCERRAAMPAECFCLASALAAATVFSSTFDGLFSFSFFLGTSRMPESLRKSFSRSSGVLA